MKNRRIALFLSFVLTVCSTVSGITPFSPLAGEISGRDVLLETVYEEAEEESRDTEAAVSEDTAADEKVSDEAALEGEEERGASGASGDSEASEADPELIDILEKKGFKKNAEGWYETVGDDGEVISYDPEDPEIFKYFAEDTGEPSPAEIDEIIKDDRLLAAGGLVHSDPYLFPLDARTYRYPSYYRTDDAGKRVGIRYGIDISKFQNVISESSFRKLKDDYMIDFVFIRAGYRAYGSSGSLNKDEKFKENIQNAYRGGLAVGVYFFSQAISRTEAREEADYCMDIVEPYRDMISLPLVIDYEYSGNPGRLREADLSASRHTEIVNAFCEEVADEGYTPMIYANKSMLQSDMEVSDIPDRNLIWLANYVKPDSSGIYNTTYSGRLSAWQFTSEYSQFGTAGLKLINSQYVDMNFWYGGFPGELCKVTFVTNGGSKVSSQTVGKGEKVRKPADPTRTGYTFTGWYKDKECTKEWDFDSDKVKKDTSIYAGWKINTYNVTFVMEGYEIEPQRINYNSKVKEPVLLLPPGYSVEGWYREEDCRTKWNFVKDTVKEDMTLYGRVQADTVKLVYHDNGGWGSVTPGKGIVDETVIVSGNGFTRDGFTYKSWNTKPDGSGDTYMEGDSFLLKPEGNDLYAIWEADILTVIFDPGQGKETVSVNAAYDSLLKEPEAPEAEGLVFTGWYEESTCQNRWDFAGSRVRRNLTLYAGWETDEDKDWGDLGREGNEDIKALYDSPADVPEGFKIYGIEDKEYTGAPITQELRVFYGKKQLASGSEYAVKYTKNTGAGTAGITVTGKGNYSGTKTDSFNIMPVSISAGDVLSAPDISLPFTGKVQKGTTPVACLVEGKTLTLKAGTDYTLSYPCTDSKAEDYDSSAFVGFKTTPETTDGRGYEEYRVKITGKGNYTGEAYFTERIYAADRGGMVPVSRLKIQSVPAQTLAYDEEGKVKPVCPEPVIKNGSEVLEAVSANSAEDGYSLVYRNNSAAGKATILVCGHGRYTGSKAVTFKINSVPISKAAVSLDGKAVKTMPAREYTGKEILQEGFSLTYAGTELLEGRDYSVSYTNNVNAGSKAAIVFTGKGIYSGKLQRNFTISRIPLEKEKNNDRIRVYMERSAPYRLTGAKPYIQVIYKDDVKEEILKAGRDYTLKYAYNKAVNDASDPKKIPTVTITGKGNYSGSIKEYFRITKAPLSDTVMTASDVIYSPKANICKPKVSIADADGSKLVAGTDYEKTIACSYAEDTEVTRKGVKITVSADTAVDPSDIIPLNTLIRAKATGRGNFEGSAESLFRFVSLDISKAEVKTADKYYTGKPVILENTDILSATLDGVALNTDNIEIVPGTFVNNINKGTAKVKVRGIGSYGGTKTVSFKIKAGAL